MMGIKVDQSYIGFYTRLTCVHIEPAQSSPSTAPSIPCETHPAQRPFITLVEKINRRFLAGEGVDLEIIVFCAFLVVWRF